MRKLKGIMINGEWLGEKVVINGVFHAICNISPIIMLEFTRLIYNLDDVKEAFSITSFEFFNNDGIKVFFSNSEIKGQAHLSFELKNDKISLKTSTLEIYSNQENIDNKVSLTESFSTDVVPQNIEALETERPVNKSIEEESDKLVTVSEETSFETAKTEENPISSVVEETFNPEIQTQDECTDNNVATTPEPNVIEDTPLINNNLVNKEEPVITREIIKQVVVEQLPSKPEVVNVQSDDIADIKEEAEEIEEINADDNCIDNEDDIITEDVTFEEETSETDEKDDLVPSFETVENNEAIEEVCIDSFTDNNLVNDDVDDFEFSETDKKTENPINEEIFNEFSEEDTGLAEELLNWKNSSDNDSDFEIKAEENADCCNDEFAEADEEVPSIENFNYKNNEDEIKSISSSPDIFMMQAILAEMEALKEELDVLKAKAAKKITTEEFFGSNDNANVIKDEDADFKILSSNDKINAAILDKDCFFAGEKVYRWGETLYLED